MNIHNIVENFNYDNLTLGEPSRLQSGIYYSQIKYNNSEFYVNVPKSKTKNGIITGKHSYCDLLFPNKDCVTVKWIIKLERKIKDILLTKGTEWFQNKMELEDIDYFFNTPLRGNNNNNYLLRCFVGTHNSSLYEKQHTLQIFDKNENEKDIEDVLDKDILSILQVKGLRFTSNSFHLEFELKQIMILDMNDIFSHCLIKQTSDTNTIIDTLEDIESDEENVYVESDEEIINNRDFTSNGDDTVKYDISDNDTTVEIEQDNNETNEQNTLETNNEDTNDINHYDGEQIKNIEQNIDSLEEFTIKMTDIENEEPLQLKKPNEVYYEIYKEARKKAKLAKRAAMIAYLEARNIKNTYMLDNINDSSDEEIDFEEI